MAGYTADNQLKGAAEETTAAGTVTAAETATVTDMVTVTARIRTATPMLKGFSVGTEDCSQRGSNNYLVMLFLAGVVQFFLFGVLLIKEKVVHTTLCTTYVEKIQPKKTFNIMFCGENVSVPLYL